MICKVWMPRASNPSKLKVVVRRCHRYCASSSAVLWVGVAAGMRGHIDG